MKYVDYRKLLGLGFDDAKKTIMLKNKIKTSFEIIESKMGKARNAGFCYDYFSEIGETPTYPWDYDTNGIANNVTESKTMNEYICKMVVLINVAKKRSAEPHYSYFSTFIHDALNSLNIPYEILEDSDGSFIFPKGAKELDDALVSEPLEWLKAYPQTRKEWIDALKDYSNLDSNNASDVADKFRKALERFFQEFFNTTKTLENLKSEYGNYMKSKGVPPEISNNLETLQQCYTNFMNNYAKHHDKTSEKLLEYIMYQTGNIIRLIITLN